MISYRHINRRWRHSQLDLVLDVNTCSIILFVLESRQRSCSKRLQWKTSESNLVWLSSSRQSHWLKIYASRAPKRGRNNGHDLILYMYIQTAAWFLDGFHDPQLWNVNYHNNYCDDHASWISAKLSSWRCNWSLAINTKLQAVHVHVLCMCEAF